jgi:hypothetical protein
MIDEPASRPRRLPRAALAVGLLAAGAVAGGVLGTALGASASDGASTAPGTNSSQMMQQGYGMSNGMMHGPGGSASVRSDEKALTGAAAAKVRAAALKAVPGGTVIRVETDAGDGVYEAHMKKADGTLVTVKLDKDYAVIRVETGMGRGDPATGGPRPTK